jgi:hypothetical protein
MSNVVQQWAAEKGYVSRLPPATSDFWSSSESPVARYLLHLKVLGIDDPTKHLKFGGTATEHYRHALELRDHTVRVEAKNDGELDIANRLATGEIDVAQAERLLAKVPTPGDTLAQETRARQMLQNATRAAYVAALGAIHLWGEDKWLGLLRPLVQAAVAAQDQQRFDALIASLPCFGTVTSARSRWSRVTRAARSKSPRRGGTPWASRTCITSGVLSTLSGQTTGATSTSVPSRS